ncbi:MAG: sugar porter family MFS transporter [Oligoflexales bacterium]
MQRRRTIALACIASLGGFLFGFDTAVISGTVLRLKETLNLSPEGLGFVVSSALLGSVLGSALSGWLSESYGRRASLKISGLLFFSSAAFCYVATTFIPLILARFLGGIGIGVAAMVAPLYIAEISPAAIRGRLVSTWQLSITLGILGAYLSNAALSHLPGISMWQTMFGAEMIPALTFFLLLFTIPESPRWLWKKDPTTAKKTMIQLLGKSEGKAELQRIRAQETSTGELKEHKTAIGMAFLLVIAAQFSGINAVIYYGPKIFSDAGFASNTWFSSTVALGVINVLATIPAILKIDTMGRRPLMLTGSIGACFCLILASITLSGWAQLPLIPIIGTYLACFAFSLGPVTWVIISEIFPVSIRGKAMSLTTLVMWVATALVAQTFPMLSAYAGPSATFLFYAACLVPHIAYVYLKVPETRGRSVEKNLFQEQTPAPHLNKDYVFEKNPLSSRD